MTAITVPSNATDPAAEARYGSAIACAAAGIDRKTMSNWLSRTPAVILLTEAERREAGERKRFDFDVRRIVQIALTADLVSLNMQPRRAAMCAAAFTDSATGSSAFPGFKQRRPAELFHGAETYLIVPPGDDPARVIPVTPDMTIADVLTPEYGQPLTRAILLRVNDVVARVHAALRDSERED